jgi:hypothetical protein
VVKNAAIAINPLDWHMADAGVFIQQWPAISAVTWPARCTR